MKKEKTPKSKLWLWLTIGAAVLAIAGTVLGFILFGGNGAEQELNSDLYWNIDGKSFLENSPTGLSMREADADGLYRILFACNGEQVEKVVADKKLVNVIDSLTIMGLQFDDDGQVVGVISVDKLATQKVKNSYVQKVENGVIHTNVSLALNGMAAKTEVTENTVIYDMTGKRETIGKVTDISSLRFMDTIHVYTDLAEENTYIYLVSHMQDAELYFRAEQQWDDAKGETARIPDENGAYSIEFCNNGEVVTLKCKDKSIVSTIDYRSPFSPHFSFEFDEEGYITKIITSAAGTHGVLVRERGLVSNLDGRTLSTTDILASGAGAGYTTTLPEDCIIYDASDAARVEGRQGKEVDNVQVGDVINIWADGNGKPVLVYIAHRQVDCPAYWNVTRMYDYTTGETTREPNAQGYYEIEMIEIGKVGKKVFKTSNKQLVNLIDGELDQTVGMKVDGSYIELVYGSEAVFGYAPVLIDTCVSTITSNIFSVIRFADPNSPAGLVMTPDCKVYDVSGIGEYGQEITLRVGDHVFPHRNMDGQIVAIMVTKRIMGEESLYYNIDYQYNGSTGTTNRQPDADGWYVFTYAHMGKQVQIKTKDPNLAGKMEGDPYGLSMAITVEDGVAVKVFHPAWAFSQGILACRVSKVHADGSFDITTEGGESLGTIELNEGCDFYNVSTVYDEFRGERISSVKVGDMVAVFTDMYNKADTVLVRFRKVDKMYWKYSVADEADADGWYYCQLAVDGELKTFKTQREDVIRDIRNVGNHAFGLRVDGDVILNYVYFNEVVNIPGAGFTEWDVVSVDGRRFTCQYNLPGHEATGTQETRTLSLDYKVYDVSPTAENFGAETELRPGDRIRTYEDKDGNHKFIYVRFRANREKGVYAYCEHCDQNVTWLPWVGGSWQSATAHYYLNTDVTVTGQSNIGDDSVDYEIILDLNGKTYRTVNSRSFLVFRGDTLTILDSVGGGEIVSTGTSEGNGAVGMISQATLNLLSGTLRMEESDQIISNGGILMVENSVFNMRGGKIADGKVQEGIYGDGFGGNIYNYNSVFNMYGGVIENGFANTYGGNIYCAGNTQTNLYGGTITGGVTVPNGVTNGKDGNIFIYHDGANITIANCTIDGGIFIGQIGDFFLTGKPVIGKGTGNADGLYLHAGSLIDVKELVDGAEIYVSASGSFTKPNEKFAEVAEAGYIKSTNDLIIVNYDEQEKVLFMDAPKDYCSHCDSMVSWYPWSVGSPASGHYYLTEDMEVIAQSVISADATVVLDLRGHKYEIEGTRGFLVYGDFTIMDSVGGGEIASTGFSDYHGGVFMVTEGVLTLLDGKISMTESDQMVSSGGIMTLYMSTLNVYGGEISGGKALSHGGDDPTYNRGLGGNIHAALSDINISGGKISGGEATDLGGNLYLEACNLTMTGGVIEGGFARNGGSIYIHESINGVDYKFVMKDDGDDQTALPVITGGKAQGDGGNFYANGLITVEAGSITNGESGNFGGNFYGEVSMNLGTSVFGSGAVIDGGIAPAGGNIALYQAAVDIQKGAVVSNGISNYDGGNYGGGGNLFVFVSSAKVSGTLLGGTADTLCGGSIYVRTSSTLEIADGAYIDGGSALYDGGNIYISSSTATINGGTITSGNAGRWGGNIYVESSNLTICDDGDDQTDLPLITEGTAGACGGNIMATCSITVEAGSVTNGEAGTFGGNFYGEGSQAATIECVLGSGAVFDGGAAAAGGNIALYLATLDVQEGAVVSNGISNYQSGDYGGGGNIFVFYSTANVSGTVTGGKADTITGGNIFVRAGELNVLEGAVISKGEARYDGGNILADFGSVVNLTDATVTEGKAGRWGGNLYVGNAVLTVSGDTQITEGTAEALGGAIYLDVNSTSKFESGTVTGDVYAVNGLVKLEVVGTPKLSDLVLTPETLITVGELADGADIFVTAEDGQISVADANVEDYAGFFRTEDGKKIFFDSLLSALAKGDE